MAVFEVPREQPDDDNEFPDGAIRTSFEGMDDFNQYLNSYFPKICHGDLHIIPGVTDLTRSELIENLSGRETDWYIEQEYGEILKLNHETEGPKDPSGAYLSKEDSDDESGYFIFYTDEAKSKYVDDVIMKGLRRTPQTNRLHVSPYRIENLVNNITDGSSDSTLTNSGAPYVDELILKRTSGSRVGSNRESDNKRTISYWGRDAASALSDLRDEFGVLISSVRVKYPYRSGDGNVLAFKIDRNGVLKLKKGKLTKMLDVVQPIIEETLDVKRAYDETEATLVTVGHSDTRVSQSTPALIIPGGEENEGDSEFTIEEIRAAFDAFTRQGYIPVDTYLEADPLYYSATAYHQQEQLYFDIRGDADALRIFPRAEQEELETFFGVLTAVHENANSAAMVASVSDVEGEQ
ncbi:hypothetical protein [Halobacterium wangiae]|uniref:hypothetical protein n=1 Tax=Halobacterium wangiae TaxID=2902623 RepID=UPI001E5281F9|nr:hypothetical protein [Halobacterium wangiae]